MSIHRILIPRLVLSLSVHLAALGCGAGGQGVAARIEKDRSPSAAGPQERPVCAAAQSPGRPALCIPKGGDEQYVVGLPEEHGWERGDWVTVNVAQPGMTNALPTALAVVTDPSRDIARVSVLYQRSERGLDGGRVRRVGKGERARLGKFVGSVIRVEGGRVQLDVGAKDDARADDIYEIRSAQDSSHSIVRVRVTELGDLHLWAAPLEHSALLREGLIAVYLRRHEPGDGEQPQVSIVVASFAPTDEQDAEAARTAQDYSKGLANALTDKAAGMQGVSVRYISDERVRPSGSDAEAHAEARSLGQRHAADVVVWGSMRCRDRACALPRVTAVNVDRQQERGDEDGSGAAGVTFGGAAPIDTLVLAAAILGSAAFDARRYADASYYLGQVVSEKSLGAEDELRARRDLSDALSRRGQTAAARMQANALLRRARELGDGRWESLGRRALARIDEQEGRAGPPRERFESTPGLAAVPHDARGAEPAREVGEPSPKPAGGFVPAPSVMSAQSPDAKVSAQGVASGVLGALSALGIPGSGLFGATGDGPLERAPVPPWPANAMPVLPSSAGPSKLAAPPSVTAPKLAAPPTAAAPEPAARPELAAPPTAAAPEPAAPPPSARGDVPARGVKVLQVAAGERHTCALLTGGVVKCWGDNVTGQLGLGDTAHRGDGPNEMGAELPAVSLGTGKTALAISAGDYYTCALLNDARVKCWGQNTYGQLGVGDTENRGDGPNEMGDNLPAVKLGTGKTALAVSAGGGHTCALLDDASVKCWGMNSSGQLGVGDTADRGDGPNEMGDALPAVSLGTGKTALAVSAGRFHTCALLDDASVKCWGTNSSGQLGLGDTLNRGDGPDEMGDALPAIDLGTAKTALAVSAGGDSPCVLLSDSSVKCWGHNSYGQLGVGDTANRGDGPDEMGDALPVVSLGAGKTALAIRAGALFTCALLSDSSVKCWGQNSYGQLGMGDTEDRGDGPDEMGDNLPAISLGAGRTALDIRTGAFHTCALLNDVSLACWGYNLDGELGAGDTANRGDGPNEMGTYLPRVKLLPALR